MTINRRSEATTDDGDNAMTRVALYARYSSGHQSVVSTEDQCRICREHAAREQWKVVGVDHDDRSRCCVGRVHGARS